MKWLGQEVLRFGRRNAPTPRSPSGPWYIYQSLSRTGEDARVASDGVDQERASKRARASTDGDRGRGRQTERNTENSSAAGVRRPSQPFALLIIISVHSQPPHPHICPSPTLGPPRVRKSASARTFRPRRRPSSEPDMYPTPTKDPGTGHDVISVYAAQRPSPISAALPPPPAPASSSRPVHSPAVSTSI